MAFVTRSYKKSPFESIVSQQLPDSPTKSMKQQDSTYHYAKDNSQQTYTCIMPRLHSQDKSNSKSNSILQSIRRSNKKQNTQSFCSIPKQQTVYQFQDKEEQMKKFIMRNKMKNKKKSLNSHIQYKAIEKQNIPYRYYDLPDSLSSNTMVKYVSPRKSCDYDDQINSVNTTIQIDSSILKQSPGPCSYDYKPIITAKGPKFVPHCSKRLDYQQILRNEKLPKIQQKLFAVKYQKMNSHFFKKSMNITKQSNLKLLSKLFMDKSRKSTADYSDPDQQQNKSEIYEPSVQNSPGPSDYDIETRISELSKNKSNIFISGEQRFQNKKLQNIASKNQHVRIKNSSRQTQQNVPSHQTQYYKLLNQRRNSSGFCSETIRFDKIQKDYRDIQNENIVGSLIKKTFCRKQIPFDSMNSRSNYYDEIISNECDANRQCESQQKQAYNYSQRKGFMAKFGNFKDQRKLFNQKQILGKPGPGHYNPQQCYHPSPTTIISPSNSNKQNLTNQQDKICEIQPQQNLKVGCRRKQKTNGTQKQKVKKKVENKVENKKIVKQNNTSGNEVLSYVPVIDQKHWNKKSYNRLFANNQTLNANNPVQHIQFLN